MNLDKLFAFVIAVAVAVVIACAIAGQLDVPQNWIWKAQAKLIYESRTDKRGSPRFFPRTEIPKTKPSTKQQDY